MTERPTVSVCLPVFNGERYLAAAIESVLAQTFADFELVVCDDLSTDSSREIIQNYVAKDSRVRLHANEAQQGLFENYNLCLSLSRAPFIKWFAQDDILYPQALERMVPILRDNPTVSLVASAKKIVDAFGAERDFEAPQLADGLHDGNSLIGESLKQYRNFVGEPVAVLVRKDRCGTGFDPNYCSLGDNELWFRVLKDSQLFFVSEPLVAFRQHKDSTTHKLLEEMTWVLDFMRIGKQYQHVLSDMGVEMEQYYYGTLASAGGYIDKLVREEKLEIAELSGFKEVAFYAMRRIGQLEQDYQYVLNTQSWKITKPLRDIRRYFNKK